MITHRPAIDWLSLTTFEIKNASKMDALLNQHAPIETGAEATEIGYEGMRGDGWFAGTRNQHGKEHYMFRFSKDVSDRIMFDPLRPQMDCTRIDIQLTLPLPAPLEHMHRLFKHAEMMVSENEGKRKGQPRKVNIVTDIDGRNSLYVGAITSERRYNLYIKEDCEHIRFECRFKSKSGLAGRVYRAISNDPTKIVSILRGELNTLPHHTIISPFKLALIGVDGEIMKNGRQRSDPDTTYRWLVKQVQPSIIRQLREHGSHDRMMNYLQELLQIGEQLQADWAK